MTEPPFKFKHAGDPSLIPGVYTYCDRWCERCRFQPRCLLFHDVERMKRIADGRPVEPQGPEPEVSPEAQLWMDELIKNQPSPAEIDQITADHDRLNRQVDADLLSVRARDYAETCHGLLRSLEPMARASGDDVVRMAVDTIAWHAFSISLKVRRALHGRLEDLVEALDQQSDAHGSAKLARLLIAESRDAWAVLMQPGRAMADGVPMRLIEMLDAIDAGLAARFPRAMDFVRAGFDRGEEE